MKVAHLNCLITKTGRLGIEKKLAARAKSVSELGLDMDFFYFNFKRALPNNLVPFFQRKGGAPERLMSVLCRYNCVTKYVDTDRYDLLVLRYGGGDFSMFSRLFRHKAHKIVTEHQAKELQEIYTYKTTFPQKAVNILMERWLGPGLLRRCAGLIANCDEVREYELERAGTAVPACTIPDGVRVKDTPFTKSLPYRGDVLNLLCLATTFHPWQGLDRVLKGLLQYTSTSPRLHLRVVGRANEEHLRLTGPLSHDKRVKVEFTGRQYGDRLEELFANTHVAFSPLAMFRKKIEGGSSLKTREYTARGLPFVIGHRDPDLEGADGFFLDVPGDDTPVDMNQVVAFAEKVLNRKGRADAMREFARERLDWKIKMKQMWDFLETVHEGLRANGAMRGRRA
jgi:glycosyltransferase involved in cell wall biosynthesis